MRLSEAASVVPLQVVRDADFAALGFVSHRRAALLVFLESDRFLDGLLANAHVCAVITVESLADRIPSGLGLALSDAPRRAFYLLHNHLASHTTFYWQDFPTEVAGDAAQFVDPLDVQSIADGIRCAVSEPVWAEHLRWRGLAQAAHFTWEATAAATRQHRIELNQVEAVLAIVGMGHSAAGEVEQRMLRQQPLVFRQRVGVVARVVKFQRGGRRGATDGRQQQAGCDCRHRRRLSLGC